MYDVYWNKYPFENSPFIGFAVPKREEPETFEPAVLHVKHHNTPPKEPRKEHMVMVEQIPSNR